MSDYSETDSIDESEDSDDDFSEEADPNRYDEGIPFSIANPISSSFVQSTNKCVFDNAKGLEFKMGSFSLEIPDTFTFSNGRSYKIISASKNDFKYSSIEPLGAGQHGIVFKAKLDETIQTASQPQLFALKMQMYNLATIPDLLNCELQDQSPKPAFETIRFEPTINNSSSGTTPAYPRYFSTLIREKCINESKTIQDIQKNCSEYQRKLVQHFEMEEFIVPFRCRPFLPVKKDKNYPESFDGAIAAMIFISELGLGSLEQVLMSDEHFNSSPIAFSESFVAMRNDFRKSMPPKIQCILRIIEAMRSLHVAGVSHGDFIPGNFIYCDNGWKINDFGTSVSINITTKYITQSTEVPRTIRNSLGKKMKNSGKQKDGLSSLQQSQASQDINSSSDETIMEYTTNAEESHVGPRPVIDLHMLGYLVYQIVALKGRGWATYIRNKYSLPDTTEKDERFYSAVFRELEELQISGIPSIVQTCLTFNLEELEKVNLLDYGVIKVWQDVFSDENAVNSNSSSSFSDSFSNQSSHKPSVDNFPNTNNSHEYISGILSFFSKHGPIQSSIFLKALQLAETAASQDGLEAFFKASRHLSVITAISAEVIESCNTKLDENANIVDENIKQLAIQKEQKAIKIVLHLLFRCLFTLESQHRYDELRKCQQKLLSKRSIIKIVSQIHSPDWRFNFLKLEGMAIAVLLSIHNPSAGTRYLSSSKNVNVAMANFVDLSKLPALENPSQTELAQNQTNYQQYTSLYLRLLTLLHCKVADQDIKNVHVSLEMNKISHDFFLLQLLPYAPDGLRFSMPLEDQNGWVSFREYFFSQILPHFSSTLSAVPDASDLHSSPVALRLNQILLNICSNIKKAKKNWIFSQRGLCLMNSSLADSDHKLDGSMMPTLQWGFKKKISCCPSHMSAFEVDKEGQLNIYCLCCAESVQQYCANCKKSNLVLILNSNGFRCANKSVVAQSWSNCFGFAGTSVLPTLLPGEQSSALRQAKFNLFREPNDLPEKISPYYTDPSHPLYRSTLKYDSSVLDHFHFVPNLLKASSKCTDQSPSTDQTARKYHDQQSLPDPITIAIQQSNKVTEESFLGTDQLGADRPASTDYLSFYVEILLKDSSNHARMLLGLSTCRKKTLLDVKIGGPIPYDYIGYNTSNGHIVYSAEMSKGSGRKILMSRPYGLPCHTYDSIGIGLTSQGKFFVVVKDIVLPTINYEQLPDFDRTFLESMDRLIPFVTLTPGIKIQVRTYKKLHSKIEESRTKCMCLHLNKLKNLPESIPWVCRLLKHIQTHH